MEERKSEYRFTEVINDWDFFLTDKTYWINQDWLWYETIISKKFLFIQRLVKHFKLNMTKIDARIALSDFNATDRMLMALAISDNPIELLIDCLE